MDFFNMTAIWSLSEAFLKNLALLIVLAYGLSLVWSARIAGPSLLRQCLCGVIFSVATVACMNMPLEPQPGLLLDQRGLILLFAASFGGPWAAILAGGVTGAYRIHLGGIGMWAGLGALFCTVILSLIVARQWGRLRSAGSAAVAGVLLTAVTIPWFFAVAGWDRGIGFIQQYGPVYLVFYVAGAVTLSGILMIDRRRRESEEQLAVSETKLRDILDVASDWFWEIDADLRFTYLSQSFRQVFSRDPSEYLGKRRSDLVTADAADEVLEYEDMLRRHQPFIDFTYSLTASDGRVRHVSICGKPVFGPDGDFLGYRGSGREVSDVVEARAGLVKALSTAERANKAKSMFLSQMSHELRTPLNAIIGFADLINQQLRGPITQEGYLQDAKDIRDSGEHLLGLINDLLDLSRIEAGKLELHPEKGSLTQILDSSSRMLRPRADAAGISIMTTSMAEDVVGTFDERAIRQVMLNLMTNAIKFTPEGGKVAVAASLEADGGIKVAVSDTGIGIPEDEQANLFKPFERAAQAQTRLIEGSGLGLPICKALVEAHGGTILMDSKPGSGTTVTFTLPGSKAGEAGLHVLTSEAA
jgi:PAS domain S-box-containing protein